MWRNILVQAVYQLAVLFCILYLGSDLFGIHGPGWCNKFTVARNSAGSGGGSGGGGGIHKINNGSSSLSGVVYSGMWDPTTNMKTTNSSVVDVITCSSFSSFCPNQDGSCYHSEVGSYLIYNSGIAYTIVTILKN
jgi:hypothetical protein